MGLFGDLFASKGRSPTTVSKEPKYVEVDWKGEAGAGKEYVRVVNLNDFSDVEAILEHLRERNSIVIMKVKPTLVQEKMELKRALKRIQRTCAAIGGDIAGVKEDIIVMTPPDVEIYRGAGSAMSPQKITAEEESSEE